MMDLPGDYVLAALSISTALTAQEQTAITGLRGVTGATIEAAFTGGTGGDSLTALVRTRIGSGGTWREVARFDFTVAASKSCTLVAGAAAIAAFAALSANTVLQGFLGTDFEAIVTSVGTYADSALSIRLAAR